MMTEDEAVNCSAFDAEAALLALGPQLEWRCVEFESLTDVEIAEAGYHGYSIECKKDDKKPGETSHFVLLIEPKQYGNVQPPQQYQNRAEAKAACERHHATGKWE